MPPGRSVVATSKMAEQDDCSIIVAAIQLKFEALAQLIKEECDCPSYNIRGHTNKAVYQQSQLVQFVVSLSTPNHA